MGKPPFSGKTKDDLKLKHLSEKPPNLLELRPDLPKTLCLLIEKCLQKDPDHRYQSAFSLYCDLYSIELNGMQPGFEFKLGAFDNFNAINAKFPLIGRKEEFDQLVNFYISLEHETRSRIAVVSGDSGSGKSRIIQEVRNFLVQRKVRFVGGSFSRHDSKISFNALASSFDEYLLKVKRTQPGEAQRLKETFQEVLGASLNELAAVIPILKDFRDDTLGKTEVSQITQIDTFTKTFLDFTSCLMSDDQPMVYIFDDIHNSDDDSLRLIDDFFTHSNTQKMYLIITFKEEYLHRRPLLKDFVERIQKLKRRFQHIKLDNLKPNEISLLLYNLFNGNKVSDSYLNWIENQTKGNPLQILELTKSLIKNNKLVSNPEGWGKELTDLDSFGNALQSSDLAISRIHNYSAEYLLILQYAAVAGMSFKAESVAVVSDFSRDIVRAALAKAKNDALIQELLSQSYVFNHYEIREALVDGISKSKLLQLHLDFAVQLSKEKSANSDQDVFSISHHYNLATVGRSRVATEILSQALRSNIRSAKLAEKRRTYHFALEYYNKSLQLIDSNPALRKSDQDYAGVLGSAAHVLIKQKDFERAKENIRKILDLNISKESKKLALFDWIQMNALQGRISEVLANARHVLGRSLLFVPSKTFFRGCLVLLGDLFCRFQKLPKFSSLSILQNHHPKSVGTRDQKILSIAFRSAVRGRIRAPLKFQIIAGGLASSAVLNETDAVDYILDRVVLLTELGLKRIARKILFEASKMHGLSSHSKAKIFLVKNIYFDFNKTEIRKSIDYFIHRKGYEVLEWPEDAQYEAVHRGMSAWVLLKQGDIVRAMEQANYAYRMLPFRNQAGTFGAATLLLCLSLKGERDQLLKVGKKWLKRRSESSNRSNDIFALVAASLIYITSGDKASCQEIFGRISKEFESNFVKKRNFPHELDLLSFYFVMYPFHFEYEFGSPLYRSKNLSDLYSSFAKGIINSKVSPLYRQIFRLLSFDFIGEGQHAYNAWRELESSLAGPNHHLLRALISTKVGLSLWKDFGKLPRISKAILQGHSTSKSLSVTLLTKAIESKLTAAGISFLKEDVSEGIANFAARVAYFPSTITEELLDYISRSDGSRGGRDDLDKAAALVDFHYGSAAVYTLEGSRLGYALIKGEQESQGLSENIKEFASGTTTSFIPTANSGDDQDDGVENSSPKSNDREFASDKNAGPKGLFEETNIYLEFDSEEVTRKNEPSLDLVSGSEGQRLAHAPQAPNRMGCLIPIKHWGDVLGYLFVDDIGELYKRDVAASRSELDYFGSILGTSVSLQNSWVVALDHVVREPDGSTIMEPCSWLHVWFHGHLRRGRESTWYLGANLGAEFYVVIYGHLDGKEQVRMRLSSYIWVSVNAIISELKTKSVEITIHHIYERVALQIQQNAADFLEITQLNFAVSLICKGDLSVESAYFGSSKPWVVGGENNQNAFNDAVATIDGYSKLLRYFHISSNLGGFHPLLLSKDPSKIDRRVDAEMQTSLAEAYRSFIGQEPDGEQLHQALEDVLGVDSMPRYYLGAGIKGA
ncbi:MAG: AAA family ATPase [Pseudomonadota bacterium]